MRSTLLMLYPLVFFAGQAQSPPQAHLDAPTGELSCRSTMRHDVSEGGGVHCIYVSSNGGLEKVYTGSFKTEQSDPFVGAIPTHWVVRSVQNTPRTHAGLSQTFSGGGDPAQGGVRVLAGQDDDNVRLELDLASGGTNPKWTTGILTLTLIRAQV